MQAFFDHGHAGCACDGLGEQIGFAVAVAINAAPPGHHREIARRVAISAAGGVERRIDLGQRSGDRGEDGEADGLLVYEALDPGTRSFHVETQLTLADGNVARMTAPYRRLKKKTRNAHMSTLFGKIVLYRFPYRFWLKNVKEPCIFPFELQLGLIEGVTPALASLIGQCHAARTQGQVLQWLKNDHGVAMGATRLRKLVAALDECLTEQSQAAQVAALLKAMETANQSSGSRKPVLAVGRDGITLCEYRYRFWEVATAATVTVFDRAGKRLTTVYLAHPPELGQATMSKMLTDLLTEVLRQWRGPLPTLAFIADSGGNESSYYEDVLRKMKHPLTDARLKWVRVVDFFHAAERVWSMSQTLFGKKSKKYYRWARRMLRLLKNKSNGPKRVLQSAAAHLARRKLGKNRLEQLRKAANYIRKRTKWMQYSVLKKCHIPIGSGITEAACKTVFTQRMKLSGMRWKAEGGQAVLNLRVLLLSGVWEDVRDASFGAQQHLITVPQPTNDQKTPAKAA